MIHNFNFVLIDVSIKYSQTIITANIVIFNVFTLPGRIVISLSENVASTDPGLSFLSD